MLVAISVTHIRPCSASHYPLPALQLTEGSARLRFLTLCRNTDTNPACNPARELQSRGCSRDTRCPADSGWRGAQPWGQDSGDVLFWRSCAPPPLHLLPLLNQQDAPLCLSPDWIHLAMSICHQLQCMLLLPFISLLVKSWLCRRLAPAQGQI